MLGRNKERLKSALKLVVLFCCNYLFKYVFYRFMIIVVIFEENIKKFSGNFDRRV